MAVEGYLYVSTDSGTLYALSSAGTVPAAASPTTEPMSTAAAGMPVAEFLWSSTGDPNRALVGPTHLAVAPDGNVWVVDGRTDRIHIISPDGRFLEVIGESGTGPGQFNFRRIPSDPWGGGVFVPDGSCYVIDTGNNRIQKLKLLPPLAPA